MCSDFLEGFQRRLTTAGSAFETHGLFSTHSSLPLEFPSCSVARAVHVGPRCMGCLWLFL